MSTNQKVRVATVKATGERYLVQQVQLGKPGQPNKVHCWGDVTAFRNTQAKHGPAKAFVLEFVDIAEVDRTALLMRGLWEQHIASLKKQGHVVTMSKTGRTYTDHGTPDQVEARREWAGQATELRREFRQALSRPGVAGMFELLGKL